MSQLMEKLIQPPGRLMSSFILIKISLAIQTKLKCNKQPQLKEKAIKDQAKSNRILQLINQKDPNRKHKHQQPQIRMLDLNLKNRRCKIKIIQMRLGLILDRVRPNQQVDNNQNSSLRIPIKLRFSNYILKDHLHLRVVQ